MGNNALVPVFTPPPIGGYIQNLSGYRYKIVSELKSGAFGTVYLGHDIFEVPYAIKVFKPLGDYEEVRNRWQEEAGKLRNLFHPYIAYMHDVFEYQYAFYIVMELLGRPLAHFVKEQPQFNDEQLIEVARQVLFGMSFIHWHHIVHRDLSLDNVLFSLDGKTVKITDFGVSKYLDPASQQHTPEPPFQKSIICPDLIWFNFTVPQSDLYHLGLILLSLKLGNPPIDPTLPEAEITRQSLDGVPRQKAEALKSPLGDKIAILLRRHLEHRYPSAIDAWDDFRKLIPSKVFD